MLRKVLTTSVQLLLDRGADIEAKDKDEQHSFAYCNVAKGFNDIVQLLLDRGADIEAKDKDEQTVLHIAISKGFKDIAHMLLDHGANIEAKDEDEQTPLDCARNNHNKEIVKLLENKKNENSWTAVVIGAVIGIPLLLILFFIIQYVFDNHLSTIIVISFLLIPLFFLIWLFRSD